MTQPGFIPPSTGLLYGCPSPLPDETTPSWFFRVAARYGLGHAKLLRMLGASSLPALEACLPSLLTQVLYVTGLAREAFSEMLFWGNTWAADSAAVWTQAGGRSPKQIQRYCLLCLESDKIPYLRYRWRFDFYRVCEEHTVLLNGACKRCGNYATPWERSPELNQPEPFGYGGCLCEPSVSERVRSLPPSVTANQLALQRTLVTSLRRGYHQHWSGAKVSPMHAIGAYTFRWANI